MKRFLLGSVIAIFISVIIFFVLLPLEKYVLESIWQVLPIPGIKQPVWLENFISVGIMCLLFSLGCTALWLVAGFFFYRIIDWKKAGGRQFWVGLFVIMLLVIIVAGYFLNLQTQDAGRYIASFFYAINGLIIYWLTSLLQSPSNVKFAPFGSIQLYKVGFINKLLN